jgi:hypothetical protein
MRHSRRVPRTCGECEKTISTVFGNPMKKQSVADLQCEKTLYLKVLLTVEVHS